MAVNSNIFPLISLFLVLITTITIAAAFAGFAIAAMCYLFVCRRILEEKRKRSAKVGASKTQNGYPKMPLFKATARSIQAIQMMQGDQYSRYTDLNQTSPNDIENGSGSDEVPRRKGGYRKLDRAKSQQNFFFDKGPTPYQALPTETENHYPQADSTLPSRHMTNLTPTNDNIKRDRPKFPRRFRRSLSTHEISSDVSQLLKNRYKSESDITMYGRNEYDEGRSTASSNSSVALSVITPAEGKVEFRLFYNSDETLDITINKLLDVSVDPINFVGILETVRHDSLDKPRSKIYLKEVDHQSFELITSGHKTGYLVYVSIPELQYKKNTAVAYANSSAHVVFNEVFSVPHRTIEDLYQLVLCIHVLIKFSDDIEPVIIGEVKVPLQLLQPCQMLPFLTDMTAPQFELELSSQQSPLFKEATLGELQVVVSFNPMISQLVVKIIQATGLPKISMTGSPNVSVKTSLYYHGKRLRKQSTSIHKRQKEPVFNESLQFDISKDRLAECDLLLEIRHHGPMHRTVIGYVSIGSSAGSSSNQWRHLLEYSHFEKLHRILPNKPTGLEYTPEGERKF